MHPLRFGLRQPFALLAFVLIVTACGSSASTPQAAPSDAAASAPVATATLLAPTQSSVVATTAASAAPVSGGSDCPAGLTSGHQKYTLNGLETWHMCGPATATVTVGGATVQISSGSCTTNAAGFAVAVGTQIFGTPDPSTEPDLLVILVDPTTGQGSVSGVASHKHWLFNGGISFGAGKLSGTFAGTTLVPGTAIRGSFTC